MFDISKLKQAAIVTFITMLAFTGNAANAADISGGDGQEKVVISIKTDPAKDPEPACVAIQIGMNLLMSIAGTAPADDVTVFLTTGGVELINPDSAINKRKVSKRVCTTQSGVNTASLPDLLMSFEGLGGNVVICPLCALSRGITEPTAGEIANGLGVHNLFLSADKVLTF